MVSAEIQFLNQMLVIELNMKWNFFFFLNQRNLIYNSNLRKKSKLCVLPSTDAS